MAQKTSRRLRRLRWLYILMCLASGLTAINSSLSSIFCALWFVFYISLPLFFVIHPSLLRTELNRVFIASFFSSFPPAFKFTRFHCPIAAPLYVYMLIVALPLYALWCAAFLRARPHFKPLHIVGNILAFTVSVMLFSLFCVQYINIQFDRAAPRTFPAIVTVLNTSSGKGGTSYYATLAYLDEEAHQQEIRLSVNPQLYRQLTEKTPALLSEYPGVLHLPYYGCTFSISEK